MARIAALFAAIALLGGALFYVFSRTAQCEQCNVILISIDTLGAKHLSLYDPSLATMPLLAKRASEQGIVFERAYSQAPWTLPSHAALLTGHYPWDLGIWEFLDALPLSVETIAERLHTNGYWTGMFSMGSFVQKEWQFNQGFDVATGSMAIKDWNDVPQLFDAAWAWAEPGSADKPFFLFIRSFEAHDPYRDGTDIHDIVAENLRDGGPQSEVARTFERGYREDLAHIDVALEGLFKKLEAADLASTTVVIITSDHGEEFGEHGTAGLHGTTVYAESVQVPLIVFVPGLPPRRVDSVVEVRSVAPTLAHLVGAGFMGPGTAPSLTPYLTGQRSTDQTAYARTSISREQHLATIESAYAGVDAVIRGAVIPKERRAPFTGPYAESVREGSFAVVRTIEGNIELYDTVRDPEESQNLLPFLDSFAGMDRLYALMLLGALSLPR